MFVQQFKYFGSVLSHDGTVDADVRSHMKSTWPKWRELMGIFCNKNMPRKPKIKVFKIMIRPAIIYGLEHCTMRERENTHYTLPKWECSDRHWVRWELIGNAMKWYKMWCRQPPSWKNWGSINWASWSYKTMRHRIYWSENTRSGSHGNKTMRKTQKKVVQVSRRRH